MPPDAHRSINALQRLADVILQKSTKEVFGLTVTKALCQGKPTIGGDTGGIRLQVINFHTGFLVSTLEGVELRIRYLFHNQQKMPDIGHKSQQCVREYLTLMLGLQYGSENRIEWG
ncbi:hypothetical protein AU255_03270 [Methyloprofundus sedimenti]|uniref:Glycosyl transferase family 1 domain-containing protein n=1 Tax=Methyloprofundus sedimenti TaxID=1420851 RepID=A0A1V8M5V2_9GAMM|nr:hypothetical protein AU255_03270 [Methyloprofundus sedimenti]